MAQASLAAEAASFPAPESKPVAAPPPKAKGSSYIFDPVRDALFIIFSPLLALVLGWAVSRVPASVDHFVLLGQTASVITMVSAGFTQSHLFAVIFRSHANASVFKQFRWRFTLVPLVVFAVSASSKWLLGVAIIVATLWDVYHSSMQVFGLARIYDSKAGVAADSGRTLDLWLAHTLYIGPIVAGVNLAAHLEAFHKINEVGSHVFDFIPDWGNRNHLTATGAVLGGGVVYLAYYLFASVRRAYRGEPVSWPKVAMLLSTGVCSIWAWGFNAFGEAFLIVNFFHALQYFAIVWWAEGKSMQKKLGVEGHKLGGPLVLAGLVALCMTYGIVIGWGCHFWSDGSLRVAAIALVNTVALMHFWYDGFVWSVRKKAIPT